MRSLETIKLRRDVIEDLTPSPRWLDPETSHQLGRLEATVHNVGMREYPDYSVEGGTAMVAEDGHNKATLSFMAYSRQTDNPGRPVALVMNGGPHSPGTLWNQNELFSPQIIRHQQDGHLDLTSPPQLNEYSLLQESDVVFLDAAGTGYGRYLSEEDKTRFFGVENDALATLAFLEAYLRSHNQENAPIILAGSSYATWRMTAVANMLQRKGRDAAALLLISGGYDYSLIVPDLDKPENNNLAAVTNLPSFAVTALYHGLAHSDLSPENYYDRAAQFAWGPYARTLLGKKQSKKEVVNQLAIFTGLDTSLIQEHDLRVPPDIFQKRLLGAYGLTLSGVDSRLAFENAEPINIDPALDRWESFYKKHVEEQFAAIGYNTRDLSYEGIIKAYPHWSFPDIWQGRSAKAAMRSLLNASPRLRIAEVSGLYDLLGNHQKRDLFWEELLPQCEPWKKKTMPAGDTTAPPVRTIATYEVPVGHQPGVDPLSQNIVGQLACRLAASVSAA